MAGRYAVIEGGQVTNVILLEEDEVEGMAEELAPAELAECPEEVGPGWGFDPEAGEFIEPEPDPDLFMPTE